ncbi:MAG: helix-turn-helix transcriptional regulator, partial [Pseudomonadota bacterium]
MNEELGATLKRLRKAYQLSLSDLSEQSGVAKSIISRIEKNETNPTISTMMKLCEALDKPLGELIGKNGAQINDQKPHQGNKLLELTNKHQTPILLSDDELCCLKILGWIKAVELIQWYDVRIS